MRDGSSQTRFRYGAGRLIGRFFRAMRPVLAVSQLNPGAPEQSHANLERNKNNLARRAGYSNRARAENPLRLETKFSSNLNLIWAVQIGSEKFRDCPVGQIIGTGPPARA